jgi:hypothetical protein
MAIVSLLILGGVAAAAPWDSKGWVKLGERTVNGKPGKVDNDKIAVGKYEGRFSKITLVVEKSDLKLDNFEIIFANGEKWSPAVKHWFKEGARTRVLDLPGDDRVIKEIKLAYENLAGGGNAAVEVWAWKTEAGPAKPAAPAKKHAWDNKGWQKLGERRVSGKADRDVITVGAYKGKFDKLQVIVDDSDLEMVEFVVTFGNGEKWEPAMRYHFKEGTRSRVIDIPGKNDRVIKSINMLYKNTPGGGAASVEVWAK